MEYEKIILNLIERVSILEEKVAELEGNKKIEPKPERGTYTSMVIDYIEKSIAKAKEKRVLFEKKLIKHPMQPISLFFKNSISQQKWMIVLMEFHK